MRVLALLTSSRIRIKDRMWTAYCDFLSTWPPTALDDHAAVDEGHSEAAASRELRIGVKDPPGSTVASVIARTHSWRCFFELATNIIVFPSESVTSKGDACAVGRLSPLPL